MDANRVGRILKEGVSSRQAAWLERFRWFFSCQYQRLVGVGGRLAELRVPQKYHLDISKIQHHLKCEISAMLISLLAPINPFVSHRYINILQSLIAVGLAGIAFHLQTGGLVLKIPNKAILPDRCGWPIRASIWHNRPDNTYLGKVPSGVLPGFEHKWWILGQWKNESFPLDSGFFRLILNLMNKCR